MFYPRRKATKKTYRKRTTRPRRRTVARKYARKTQNYAKVVELTSAAPGVDEVGQTLDLNTPYEFATTLAKGHPRCAALAQTFEKYKITNAMWKFLPRATDFAPGTPPPYIYIHKMKSANVPLYFDANWLQSMGTKPILFNRPITINMRPAVQDGVINDTSGNAFVSNIVGTKAMVSPWLATHDMLPPGTPAEHPASSTEHFGLLVFIAQQGNSSNGPICEYESGITALFSKPFADYQTAPQGANTLVSFSS